MINNKLTGDNDLHENPSPEVPLIEGIRAAELVLDLFLQNSFNDAKSTAKSFINSSMYHAVSYGTMLHLQATATLEPSELEDATIHIKSAVKACIIKRRKTKIMDSLSKSSVKSKSAFYGAYTDEEAHAELCYAESLLQWVFLAVLQDEKLVTLIKSSLKLRECYKCYRTCWKIYKNKDWGDSPARPSFECGVLMGVGAFNLLLSMLPTKVLSLLEIVGFSGNKEVGLQLLQQGCQIEHGVRDPLCALIRLVYDLYATQMTGDTTCDPIGEEALSLIDARLILTQWASRTSNSAFFLFLDGRLDMLCGKFQQAEGKYFKAISCQSDFINFHHICYWELMWCHAAQGEWMDAMKYAEKLACESKWSQATYRYLEAIFILQFLHADDHESQASSLVQHAEELLSSVSQFIQRIAGKSLPIEKFSVKKAARYFDQGNRLTLPGIEILYLWNGFKMISTNQELINKFLLIIEEQIRSLVANEASVKNFADNFCLATLLKGVCLRCLNKTFQAKMCFNEVISYEKSIRLDRYLLPFSEVELCQMALEETELGEAKVHLDKAWSYTKYSLEARLSFRLHTLTALLKAKQTSKKLSKSLQPSPAGSWHKGLNSVIDGEDNPFNIQFDPKIDNIDDEPIHLELESDK